MARNYKATTITIHTELLAQFKDYCAKTKLPLSRFFSLAAQKTSITQHTQFLERVFKRRKIKPRKLNSTANSKIGFNQNYQFNNNKI